MNVLNFSFVVGIHPSENDVGWKRSSPALDLGLFTGDQCSGWKKVRNYMFHSYLGMINTFATLYAVVTVKFGLICKDFDLNVGL